MAVWLDGFIAKPDDDPGELFDWYGAGETSVDSANDDVTFQVDEKSAELLTDLTKNNSTIIAGRRLLRHAESWDDHLKAGGKVVVVTHEAPDNADQFPRTTFVGDVKTAISTAPEIAGDRGVTIASADIAPASALPRTRFFFS